MNIIGVVDLDGFFVEKSFSFAENWGSSPMKTPMVPRFTSKQDYLT